MTLKSLRYVQVENHIVILVYAPSLDMAAAEKRLNFNTGPYGDHHKNQFFSHAKEDQKIGLESNCHEPRSLSG